MKIEKKVLTRVEGEASLKLEWERGRIKDAKIIFNEVRGIERVLKGKPFMDALVINPRVCGICGHAHLIATVKALEDALGIKEVPKKAEILRRITRLTEILQNHVKWFYLFIMPDFLKLQENLNEYKPFSGSAWREAVKVSSEVVKVIALFSGQWPHSSYAIPGGVTSTPSEEEVFKAKSLIRNFRRFFLSRIVGVSEEEFRKLRKRGDYGNLKGDLGKFLELCEDFSLNEVGRSYGRFISGGGFIDTLKPSYKRERGRRFKFSPKFVEVLNPPSYTLSRPVRYKGLPYETGPLARQVLCKNPLIEKMFSDFGDSFSVRVSARVLELWEIIEKVEELLTELLNHINERSAVGEIPKEGSGSGTGIVEAARGTLIHRVEIEKGRIRSYEIITPSQWNLGPRCEKYLGVAEKAIIGLDSSLKAEMILRSFDLCSVCTTH
ncbi:nickel-dependent hydrogenase large subunit [Aquifex pyrophilus]